MTRFAPRRSTLRLLFALGLAGAAMTIVAAPRPAAAQPDPRAEARANYEQGKKLYASGDYRGAVAAFARAEALAPSPYNDFNIALCYDKLGEAGTAVQYYRSYLQKAPDATNRSAVEASITRLEAAAKAADAKADEQRRAEEARRAEDARKADEARRAEEAKRAEEQRLNDELARKAEEERRANGGAGTGAVGTGGVGPGTGTGVGPGTGTAVTPTGDPELDKVQGIDINAIRTQRGGFEGTAPASGAGAGPSGAGTGVGVATTGPDANGNPQNPATMPTDQPKPKKPVYKQWWFWVVVGVSAYVLISIAAADSPNQRGALATGRLDTNTDHDGAQDVERRWTVLPDMGRAELGTGGGATLLRW